MKKISLFAFVIALPVAGSAQDHPPVADLPPPISNAHFEALLTQSPFLRTPDPAATYTLRGLATTGGKPVATLFNRQTEESVMVTADGRNEAGMTLVDVSTAEDLSSVSIRVAMSGEEFELKYEADRVAPSPNMEKRYGVQYDQQGRPMNSKVLMEKYMKMSREQKMAYYKWRSDYYRKHPDISRSEKRFPIVDKAMEAIKAGKQPPKP